MMEYKTVYSKLAIRDLKRIEADVFQACQDDKTTKAYLEGLVLKIHEIKTFPESFTPLLINNTIITGFRFVIYKSYIAFFAIEGDKLLVDRILFSRSDYMSQLEFKEVIKK